MATHTEPNGQIVLPLGLTRKAPATDWGYLLYVALHACGFIAMTLLMTWGVIVLFFLAIGGFTLDGMMHHLANLASRYLAADAARVAQFKLIVAMVHLVIASTITFFRRHAIIVRDPRSESTLS